MEKENRIMREALIKIWDLSLDKSGEKEKLNNIWKICNSVKKKGIWLN